MLSTGFRLQPVLAQDDARSPYDFDQLSSMMKADQIDYHSGDWSYTLPLTTVQGEGLSLPLALQYSSAVTGLDRLTKLQTVSRGTHTLNQAGWVGLGWNLIFGAVVVNGGYNTSTNGNIQQHPYAFDMSLVLPDGVHHLVRQLDANDQPTDTFYFGRRKFWKVRINYDPNSPLTSTWEAQSPDGVIYRFGAQPPFNGEVYGFNNTTESAIPLVAGTYPMVYDQMAEFVYQWQIAEIVDPKGHYIRFYYEPDNAAVTTYRSTQEEFTPPNLFKNYLMVQDLDPWIDPSSVGDLEVIKTFHTAYLSEIRFYDPSGVLLRRVETIVSDRNDLPLSSITIESLRSAESDGDLALFNHLRNDVLRKPPYFRSLDGISTTKKLKALVVRNAQGLQMTRFDFSYSNRPVPSPTGDQSPYDTMVLDAFTIEGKEYTTGLPSYLFEYSAEDSYRLSRLTLPIGGIIDIEYEPFPDVTSPASLFVERNFYEHARRVKRRNLDADLDPSTPVETTEYEYPQLDIWRVDVSNFVESLTHPVVDEIMPQGHGSIRRYYLGKSNLLAMGFNDSLSIQGKINRDIRRGTLIQEVYLDVNEKEVKRTDYSWQFDPQGSYIGYSWFADHGVNAQSFWIRQNRVTTWNDGVKLISTYDYNPDTGQVIHESVGDLVTRTRYVGDGTSSLESTQWMGVTIDSMNTYNDTAYEVDNGRLWVSARAHGSLCPESEIGATFTTTPWVPSKRVYRISGMVGIDSVSAGNIFSSGQARVYIDWSNGSRETVYLSDNLYQQLTDYQNPSVMSESFSETIIVPEDIGPLTGTLSVELKAYVHKPIQTFPRYIRTFADGLTVEAIDFAENQDPEYPLMAAAYQLTAPASVRILDREDRTLRYTEYHYGNFSGRYLPDSTMVWLDVNGDGELLDDRTEKILSNHTRSYNTGGHPVETVDPAGTVSTTIYGYRGTMPMAGFTNAHDGEVEAFVFDDHGNLNALITADPRWSTSGNGPISLIDGVLVIDNGQLKRTIPVLNAGVLELDAMIDIDSGDYSALSLFIGSTPALEWTFAADGRMYAGDGRVSTPVGLDYRKHRWYHIRIEWNQSLGIWHALVDGVRYPDTGDFPLASGTIDRLVFDNTLGAGGLYIDRIRLYPASARPGRMVTFDPINFSVTQVTDTNGVTAYFDRDGLGRVARTRNADRRVLGQRYAYFSRSGVLNNDVYRSFDPNQAGAATYPDPAGYLDFLMGEDVYLQTNVPVNGAVSETGPTITTGAVYEVIEGGHVTFTARNEINLNPGFHAGSGAEFLARIDPGMPGIGEGDVTYNVAVDNEIAVRMGPESSLNAGVGGAGRTTVRVDFYPSLNTGGILDVICFEDDTNRFSIQYDASTRKFRIESIHNGGSPILWPFDEAPVTLNNWYTCEIERHPEGTCTAWAYPQQNLPGPDNRKSEDGFPSGWMPQIRSYGFTGDFYLANFYMGPAERSYTFFDGAARTIQTQTLTDGDAILTHTDYNAMGQTASAMGPIGDNGIGGRFVPDPDDHGKRIDYGYTDDPLSRVRLVIPPGHDSTNGVWTSYGNDGWSDPLQRYVSVRDEKGYITTQYFNRYGQMVSILADSGGIAARTLFNLDMLGQLKYSVAPEGDRTYYFYDTLGRMTGQKYPDADDTTRFKYDIRGNVRFTQDARQRTIDLFSYIRYDIYGRVIRSGEAPGDFGDLDAIAPYGTYPFETDATTWSTKNTYDHDFLLDGGQYALGRLTMVEENSNDDTNADIILQMAYDREGMIVRYRMAIDDLPGKTIRYDYDLKGRMRRLIYPDDTTVDYAYDSAGRLSNVTDGQGVMMASYAYQPDGTIATHTVGNDLVTGTYAYTPRGWIKSMDYADIFAITNTYDAVGNVTQQSYRHGQGLGPMAASYSYDGLHRLAGASHTTGLTQGWVYDKNGNITTRTTNGSPVAYAYASTPNRLTGTGDGVSYGYDANGAMTIHGNKTLTYDYRGFVTGYSDPAKNYTYLMDSAGKRVKKAQTGTTSGTVYYLRGADGSVLAEYDGNYELARKYVFAGSERIAYIENDTTSYYLKDPLGSTRAVLTEYGEISAEYDYRPFGEIMEQTGTGDTRFKFTGHERDDESELDYMLARMYDPALGRFLRIDPQARDRSWLSPYNYVQNNPVNRMDPTGALDTEFKDKDGKPIKKVPDGSNATFQLTGESRSDEYFAFTGYDESEGGENEVNVQSVINFTQDYTRENYISEPKEDGGWTTYCSAGNHCIANSVGSALNASGITLDLQVFDGLAREQNKKLAASEYSSLGLVDAQMAAQKGSFVVGGFKGHVFTLNKDGLINNVGSSSAAPRNNIFSPLFAPPTTKYYLIFKAKKD